MKKRIVVVGGGYGGLKAAMLIEKDLPSSWELILVDRKEKHELVTELHRVASGTLPAERVSIPFKIIIEGKNVQFIKGNVDKVETDEHQVAIADKKLRYDALVLAPGSTTEFFDIKGAKDFSMQLKSIDDSLSIREKAEKCFQRKLKGARKGVIVVGAGLTGMEVAGYLGSMALKIAKRKQIVFTSRPVTLIEAQDKVLQSENISRFLRRKAVKILQTNGVQVKTGTAIQNCMKSKIELDDGRTMPYSVLIWTAGVRAAPLLQRSGISVDSSGRAFVKPTLQTPEHPEVFVLGDAAHITSKNGETVPPSAQIALQEAEIISKNVIRSLKGARDKNLRKFKPDYLGKFIALGNGQAVGYIRNHEIYGHSPRQIKEAVLARYLFNTGLNPFVTFMPLGIPLEALFKL